MGGWHESIDSNRCCARSTYQERLLKFDQRISYYFLNFVECIHGTYCGAIAPAVDWPASGWECIIKLQNTAILTEKRILIKPS